jgi:hypothetical protein
MSKLGKKDVLRIIREEWDTRIKQISEELNIEQMSDGLKVKHIKSKILYTIDSVSPRDVILVSPEGEKFAVSAGEFEEGYQLS